MFFGRPGDLEFCFEVAGTAKDPGVKTFFGLNLAIVNSEKKTEKVDWYLHGAYTNV